MLKGTFSDAAAEMLSKALPKGSTEYTGNQKSREAMEFSQHIHYQPGYELKEETATVYST